MRWAREMPREGTWRTRLVRAWFPMSFTTKYKDGTPFRIWIWLEKYQIDEVYQYGYWQFRGRKLP